MGIVEEIIEEPRRGERDSRERRSHPNPSFAPTGLKRFIVTCPHGLRRGLRLYRRLRRLLAELLVTRHCSSRHSSLVTRHCFSLDLSRALAYKVRVSRRFSLRGSSFSRTFFQKRSSPVKRLSFLVSLVACLSSLVFLSHNPHAARAKSLSTNSAVSYEALDRKSVV